MTEQHQDGTDRIVTVNGLRLFTRRRPGRGEGVPLVLVHGIGGSLESWQPLLAAMPDRDVIMIDTPGAGRSQVPILPFPIAGLADCVAGAVRALRVQRVDVLGSACPPTT
jgi:pimeloyl-ACP methyl ester carboxylesterase